MIGVSNRYEGGSDLGQSGWFFDSADMQTHKLVFSERSDGRAFTSPEYLSETGAVFGFYNHYDANDSLTTGNLFYWSQAEGMHDLDGMLISDPETFGWSSLGTIDSVGELNQLLGRGTVMLGNGTTYDAPFLITNAAATGQLWLFDRTGDNGQLEVLSAIANRTHVIQLTTEQTSFQLLQTVQTDTNDPMVLSFDYQWLSPSGSLEISLGEVELLDLTPDGVTLAMDFSDLFLEQIGDGFTRMRLVLDHEDLFGLTMADLEMLLHPGSQSQIQIDNFSFNVIPEPATYALLLGSGCLLIILVRCRRRND